MGQFPRSWKNACDNSVPGSRFMESPFIRPNRGPIKMTVSQIMSSKTLAPSSLLNQQPTFFLINSYTQSKADKNLIYAIFLRWPSNDTLVLGSVRGDDATKVFQITPDGSHIAIRWNMKDQKMFIKPQLFPQDFGARVLKIYLPLPGRLVRPHQPRRLTQ